MPFRSISEALSGLGCDFTEEDQAEYFRDFGSFSDLCNKELHQLLAEDSYDEEELKSLKHHLTNEDRLRDGVQMWKFFTKVLHYET